MFAPYESRKCKSVNVFLRLLADVTSRFDRVFWFGDFNFRVERKRSETDEIFANRDFADQDERKMFIVEVCFLLFFLARILFLRFHWALLLMHIFFFDERQRNNVIIRLNNLCCQRTSLPIGLV